MAQFAHFKVKYASWVLERRETQFGPYLPWALEGEGTALSTREDRVDAHHWCSGCHANGTAQ